MSVFILSFIIFLTILLLDTNLGKSIKAFNSPDPSIDYSFMLAFPLTVNGANNETSKITVFVRDSKTIALTNKSVALTTSLGSIVPLRLITDIDGKVQFTLNCQNQQGVAQINGIIDGRVTLTKTVTVKCI